MEENKIEIPKVSLPEVDKKLEEQQKYVRKIYKAIFRALKSNCDCEVCRIMREISDFIEQNI
jgi:hypothetical protein